MPRTQRQPIGLSGDQRAPDAGAERPRAPPRRSTTWVQSGSGYGATIDGRDYRVAKYPADSPLTAPYGAYAEGRFIGSGPTLESVKGRCGAHAARLRFRLPASG
jgi:hypothetical protein